MPNGSRRGGQRKKRRKYSPQQDTGRLRRSEMKSANKVHLSPRKRRTATTNGHWPATPPTPSDRMPILFFFFFCKGRWAWHSLVYCWPKKKKKNKDTGRESVSNFSLWRINLDSWQKEASQAAKQTANQYISPLSTHCSWLKLLLLLRVFVKIFAIKFQSRQPRRPLQTV